MSEVYIKTSGFATASPAEDRGSTPASRRQIDKVKEGTRIELVAAGYGEFRMVANGQMLGRCVSPHHEDKTPSMTVYTGEQRFRCYGCGEHGDVLDLVMLAEPGMELWVAMLSLSQRYGIELPPRPDSWFRRQKRQKPMRDAIEEAKLRLVQRRLFRVFLPLIEALEDPDERREEIELIWADTRRIAALVVAGRTS